MRMYKITRQESEKKLFIDDEDFIVEEIESDMKYWGYSLCEGEIIALPYNLRDLDIGDARMCGPFTITVIDIPEEEFNNLSEFDGW